MLLYLLLEASTKLYQGVRSHKSKIYHLDAKKL